MSTPQQMERLRQRQDFLTIAQKGTKSVSPSLILQHLNRGDDLPPRIGFTASRKVGNAITRNRAKRRMRKLAELHLTPLATPGSDYVLIARHNTSSKPWQDLVSDFQLLLKRLN